MNDYQPYFTSRAKEHAGYGTLASLWGYSLHKEPNPQCAIFPLWGCPYWIWGSLHFSNNWQLLPALASVTLKLNVERETYTVSTYMFTYGYNIWTS